ncbi:peptidylprolyl isomerase [Rodentibacter pneumotropicus]|uniref:Periplasmic chaperone PpiD n=1 Tax=Rodentibacter pneumotropicus TaxID=758 RepID=A0A4S2PES2_9PAST|nr:peptidylprolyl isomerase [Rodentibacter pneumotropicus]THA01377.1 peptidylprolyl isomerase [Rodentibacter pneumotropicus]THA01635.1 peptidylprolyl isomerase [Rodentibacter pneumotropicus]THA10134.1 peptidylprolyl isomerase [Rodentibacter pneumotropicus]THA12999.1 peptidylprolyl isomerase [Rodentibacter pneumotropicus]
MFIEKMNGMANTKIAKFILGLITISFLVGGMSGYLFSNYDSYAAKVNGETISQQDFMNRYNQEFETRAAQEGEAFLTQSDSPEFVNALRQGIINRLVDQELLRQYAKELKLGVSDEMIKRAIVVDPNFQSNGKFDNGLYQQILAQNGLSSDTYANILRGALTLEQMQNGIANSEFVVPVQVKDNAQLLFQKRIARLATLSLADEIAKQNITEDEVKTYYEANQKAFVQPEQVKVQYIQVSGADVAKDIQVSDVEIAQYYQDNKAQFMTQKLAHIQFSNEQEAQTAYQELKNGASFAELAKTRSLDKVSGEKGGELGWVNANELPRTFEEAATMLQVGKFSEPVNVEGNFHIILVEERKEKPLDEVKTQITDLVRKNLLENRFYTVEKNVREKAFEDSKSLESAANVAGVKVQESGYFSRENVPEALNSPNVISAMFDSDISNGGANSEPLNIGEQHIVLVRVLDHKAEGIKALDEAKTDIENFLKREKAEKILTATATKLVNDLPTKPNKLPVGISFGSEQTFAFTENKDPILTNGIFSMEKPANGTTVYKIVRNSKGDVIVAALSKVEKGELNEQELAQFGEQFRQTQQLELRTQLLQALRDKAQIEINEAFIKQEDEN